MRAFVWVPKSVCVPGTERRERERWKVGTVGKEGGGGGVQKDADFGVFEMMPWT